jgi:hypothetical protein
MSRALNHKRQRAASAAVIEGVLTVQREQHGRVTRETVQIADAHGNIGSPFRAENLLAQLERRGDIGARERTAGEKFHELFRIANLDPLRAADMGQRIHGANGSHMPHGSEWARGRINDALDALGGHGSPCGSAAWFILGDELSMREWATREGWGGRPIREEVAKGTLIGALGVLVKHFGV